MTSFRRSPGQCQATWRLVRPWVAVCLLLSGCGVFRTGASDSTFPTKRGSAATFGKASVGQITVRHAPDRPTITTVTRSGDPSSAVAVVVFTGGGSTRAVALAAIVESRLRAAGVASVSSVSNTGSYRLQALAASAREAGTLVRALRAAMGTPIVAGSKEIEVVRERLVALRARALDAPMLEPIVQCTGALAVTEGPKIDVTQSGGIAQLERWRRESHTVSRVALAVVGPKSVADAVVQAVDRAEAWEQGSAPDDPWPKRDRVGAYIRASRSDGSPMLNIAVRVRDPFAATAIAEETAVRSSFLLERLSTTPAWDIERVSATVRPRGACVGITLRRAPTKKVAGLYEEAANVAALVVKEIETELAEARADGSVAGRQVLQASDPREAASLAAWWSLGSRLPPGQDRLAVALGLPPATIVPRGKPTALDRQRTESNQRFVAEFGRARGAWGQRAVEARTRVEPGQGGLWVLVASPCGLAAETELDAGITALAAMTMAEAEDSRDGVRLEPWVAQDGVGILAHGPAGSGEGPHAHAGRIANAAARALVRSGTPNSAFVEARTTLLAAESGPRGPSNRSFAALAKNLVPSHPSWLAPFGLHHALVEAGPKAAALRWSTLADGPVRVAVLANHDKAQASAAIRAADRWFVRRSKRARSCPPVTQNQPTADRAHRSAAIKPAGKPHAQLGIVIRSPTPAASEMMHLLAEGLRGQDGWLARAMASFPARVETNVRVVGGERTLALVIETSCRQDLVDPAIRQVRAVLERLMQGAATQRDLDRARQRLASKRIEERLDPRRRLVDLWRGRPRTTGGVGLAGWRAWMANTLRDDAVYIVRAIPEPKQP